MALFCFCFYMLYGCFGHLWHCPRVWSFPMQTMQPQTLTSGHKGTSTVFVTDTQYLWDTQPFLVSPIAPTPLSPLCLLLVHQNQCTSLSKMLSTEKKHNTQWKVPLLLLFDLFAVPWALDSKPEFSDKRGRYLIPVWFSPSGIRSSKQVPGVPFYHFQSARNAKISAWWKKRAQLSRTGFSDF